ncbi:cupin domain-containing protein, partial [Neobacillus drentensis]
MYYIDWMYPNPYQQNVYYANAPMYNYVRQPYNWNINDDANILNFFHSPYRRNKVKDYGRKPLVVNINEAAKQNNTYRTALWTGNHLQVTLMSLKV